MFWTMTKNGVARIEADHDDFLVSAPTLEDLDILSQLLKNWDGKSNQNNCYNNSAQPASFQHVGLKITKMINGGIHISDPKKI